MMFSYLESKEVSIFYSDIKKINDEKTQDTRFPGKKPAQKFYLSRNRNEILIESEGNLYKIQVLGKNNMQIDKTNNIFNSNC